MPTVVIKRGRAKPLWMGHPWVHADSVHEVREDETEAGEEGNGAARDVVRVVDEEGKVIGRGLLSPTSAIRVRMLAWGEGSTDADRLLEARIDAAVALRAQLLPPESETDAYRLVHSEGDGLPGLVVDRFAHVLVAQMATAPMHRRRERIAAHLLRATGARTLVQRAGGFEKSEGIDPEETTWTAGEPAPDAVRVREAGMTLDVDAREGQKTGHYADQRENRLRVAEVARGADVLDLYAGTGGFAVQALRRGAARCVAVESSARACAALRGNAASNGVADRVEVREDDARTALLALRDQRAHFGVVVADPPNFLPRRGGGEGGAWKAYRELNARALSRVAPGGFLATFSCSARVNAETLLTIVREAGRECRRQVSVLRELTAGPDHPVAVEAPEGRYLTGLLLRVRPT